MLRGLLIIGVFLPLLLLAADPPASAPLERLPLRADFLPSRAWDDGKAEVSVYDSRRTIYGKERVFESVMIVVKERVGTVLCIDGRSAHQACTHRLS